MNDRTAAWTAAFGRVREKVKQPGILAFFRNIGVTFVFKGLSLILTLIISVVCVREFGAALWGRAALIGNLAGILYIPLTFGFYYGVVKHLPLAEDKEGRELMGTALAGNLVSTAGLGLLFLLVGSAAERSFGLSAEVWSWAIALAASINLYILAESFLRGKQRFLLIGSFKLYASLLSLAGVLFGLYVLGIRTLSAYVWPTIAYNLLFFAAGIGVSRPFSFRVSRQAWQKLFAFGTFTMLSSLVSALLFTGDLLFVARFGTDEDVGVYSVYQSTIRSLCTILFHDVFAVVFLPMIAGKDKRRVDRAIRRYFFPIAAGIGAAAAVIATGLVLLYGGVFPLKGLYVALTAGGISLNIMYLLTVSVVSLDGVRAARLAFLALAVPLPFLLALQYFLIRQWGLTGGMVSVLLLNAVLLVSLRILLRFRYPAWQGGNS
ncbi:oligosaccharide flippase family protein [Gorillibacterium massiliense]|uniref:oligosaccharide flippase family protein n=1 Tax=Gorillibacterium massiliense TaxID=1280390 RepID=UPI0004B40283|nr:oligosaccharide flippase family protein [Gorillibacterium massiliense]